MSRVLSQLQMILQTDVNKEILNDWRQSAPLPLYG